MKYLRPPRSVKPWTALAPVVVALLGFSLIYMPGAALAQVPPTRKATLPKSKTKQPTEEEQIAGIGGQWRVIQPNVALKAKLRLKVSPMWRNGFQDGDQEILTEYYKRCVLPRWTIKEEWVHSTIAKPGLEGEQVDPRKELENHLRQPALYGQDAVHDYMVALLLRSLAIMTAGMPDKDGLVLHPVARINAMLMIGELNQTEPIRTQAAVPLPEALPVLLAAAMDVKEFQALGKAAQDALPKPLADALGESAVDGVRAAAMIGILRHVNAGINDANAKALVVQAMVKLLTTQLPQGRQSDVRIWVKARAADVLGILAPANNPAVVEVLQKTVADTNCPLLVRCAAARALAPLATAGAGNNAVPMLRALGQLALDSLRADKSRQAQDLLSRRRRLASLLAVVQEGLQNPGLLATLQQQQQPDQRKNYAGLIADVTAMFNDVADKTVTEAGLGKKIEKWKESLETRLKAL